MPKDEFDPEDPMECHGVALPGDTSEAMAECIVEEYVMQGFSDVQIRRLFADPNYTGTHRVQQERGEAWVKDLIERVRARWGQIRLRTESATATPH